MQKMGPEGFKLVGDGLSVGVWLGALVELLPAIAALVSIMWGLIRIYETRTIQKALGKRHIEFDPDDYKDDE